MATNLRQQIMAKVDTALKAILTSASYETNLGQKVYEWRGIPIEDDATPSCTYRETDAGGETRGASAGRKARVEREEPPPAAGDAGEDRDDRPPQP